jgi:uncharacterized lipoprotein YddW (UPF0748 family)
LGQQALRAERSWPDDWRGVWIASHHHSAVWQSRDALARALDQLVALGWNTIFPAVWNRGYTAWPSAVMHRFGLPAQDPLFAATGVDPLRWAVDLARERGLSVIPWLEYGFAAEPVGRPGPLLAARPEWAARDRRGQVVEHGGLRWLNALNPDVGEMLTRLLAEVVERYAVDGVQGDDHIAVPRGGSHDTATLARYRQLTGRAPAATHDDRTWRRFRADALSRWVRQTGERLHALRPGLRWCLSPAPWPTGWRELSQDSAAWLAEGSVDLLLPQLYRHSFAAYRQLLRANLRRLPPERRRQVVAGLTLRANGRALEKETLRRMVQLSRAEGLGGVAVFHLTPLLAGEAPLALAPGDALAGFPGRPAPSPLP